MNNKLTKTAKVVRWASVKKNRNIKRAMGDLGQDSRSAFILLLNRLSRKGFIHYSLEGNRVQLGLTLEGYYSRGTILQ